MKLLQRPERGWDPIPAAYARVYAAREYARLDRSLVDDVEAWAGGFAGKRVMDLGGGPGQYALEFARRGAEVHWHDISRHYLEIARREAESSGLGVKFSLGYMEDASGEYDVVFNRVCWYYCVSDASFARKVVDLTKPGGVGYLIINTDRYMEAAVRTMPWARRLKSRGLFALNELTSLKVGHIMSSHRTIERLFRRLPLRELDVGWREEMTLVRYRR